jgi:hypothetical protein
MRHRLTGQRLDLLLQAAPLKALHKVAPRARAVHGAAAVVWARRHHVGARRR